MSDLWILLRYNAFYGSLHMVFSNRILYGSMHLILMIRININKLTSLKHFEEYHKKLPIRYQICVGDLLANKTLPAQPKYLIFLFRSYANLHYRLSEDSIQSIKRLCH